MNPFNYFKISITALLANKIRSILTMLGVVIGVFSVITFLSIGEGLKDEVTGQFESFGSNLLFVVPGQVDGFQSFGNTLGASTLSMKDVNDIRTKAVQIEALSPLMIVSAVITKDGKTVPGPMVVGTDDNIPQLQTMEISEGNFFTEDDVNAKHRVAVLGGNPREKIFGQDPAAGKTIGMLGQEFIVVGSLKKPEGQFSLGGGGPDDFVYIPITTAQEITGSEQIARILVKAKSAETIPQTKEEIKKIVLENHKEEDFTVLEQSQIVDLFNDLFGNLAVAVSGIGAISLLVGGIGIMNIMFVSVTERTKEIGLRKALGATNRNILIQFLMEASLLSLLGGAIGIGLSMLATFLLKKTVGLPSQTTLPAILIATGVSVAIGVIFGIVPAFRAARKNPIEALRYE